MIRYGSSTLPLVVCAVVLAVLPRQVVHAQTRPAPTAQRQIAPAETAPQLPAASPIAVVPPAAAPTAASAVYQASMVAPVPLPPVVPVPAGPLNSPSGASLIPTAPAPAPFGVQPAAAQQPEGYTNDNVADGQTPGGEQRLSQLETAFDAFERQLEREAGATKFPSAKLTGFTQLDNYFMQQSRNNIATVGDGQNGLGFRRARLAVLGNVAQFTAYQLEVDFATAGRPSFFDCFVEQDEIPWFGAVRVGQYLQPFSVDAMSGFRHLPFMERSLPFLAFVPFRRVGAMASNKSEDEMTYWAYSIFKTGGFNNAPLGDSRFATDIGDQGGVSFSTRVTQLLFYDEPSDGRYLWHVGGAYNFSSLTGNLGNGTRPFYQARTGPEFGPIGDGIETSPPTFGPVSYAASNFTPPNFVDTGRFRAHSFNLLGFETVFQNGPFNLQSEFMVTEVNSIAGPVWYTGAYVEVMYRLTGEQRGYDKRLAALKNPVPFTDFISLRRGIVGLGAWEVAARLSYIDLRNPGRLQPSMYVQNTNNSGNGTLTDLTLGGTWFLNYHTKVQFDWVYAMLDNSQRGNSVASNYVSRVQVDF